MAYETAACDFVSGKKNVSMRNFVFSGSIHEVASDSLSAFAVQPAGPAWRLMKNAGGGGTTSDKVFLVQPLRIACR